MMHVLPCAHVSLHYCEAENLKQPISVKIYVCGCKIFFMVINIFLCNLYNRLEFTCAEVWRFCDIVENCKVYLIKLAFSKRGSMNATKNLMGSNK